LYETEDGEDGEKKIRRDDENDPVIKDSRVWDEDLDDWRDIVEDDRAVWKEMVEAEKNALIMKWQDRAACIPSEILAILSAEAQAEV